MTRSLVERIADAVLYEGYLLYPYRPSSVKNRQRWTFGGLFPQDCDLARAGDEPCSLQAECLVEARPETTISVRVRFLHLIARSAMMPDRDGFSTIVGGGGQLWQEAADCTVEPPAFQLDAPRSRHSFSFPAQHLREPVRDPTGHDIGEVVRDRCEVRGVVEWSATSTATGHAKLTVRVINLTPSDRACTTREELLPISLVSAHVILEAREGAFVSLLDPPAAVRDSVAGCVNVGVWPVLVGEAGDRDTMLASPIILYDHPEIAPESPGDLFDATEIDEILTLRILTMTDDEKREMRLADPRADALLARTEALTRDDLMRLHGTLRSPRSMSDNGDLT
jgi:hypothetical protein